MQKWYLLAVKPGQSSKAQVMLHQQAIETYSPRITVDDGKSLRFEPAFASYLFARFDPLHQSMAAVNNTRGVRHVVSFGGQPAIVDDKIIDAMRDQFDDTVIDAKPKRGDRVIINIGPFSGITAIYHETDKLARDVLLIQLVHKQHKIYVDRDSWVSA